jgi:hypothetical protein
VLLACRSRVIALVALAVRADVVARPAGRRAGAAA